VFLTYTFLHQVEVLLGRKKHAIPQAQFYGQNSIQKLETKSYRQTPWPRGIVSACHRGDWWYGSWDRIPPWYRVVAFIEGKKLSTIIKAIFGIKWQQKATFEQKLRP
jgi:hypothetical protein